MAGPDTIQGELATRGAQTHDRLLIDIAYWLDNVDGAEYSRSMQQLYLWFKMKKREARPSVSA